MSILRCETSEPCFPGAVHGPAGTAPAEGALPATAERQAASAEEGAETQICHARGTASSPCPRPDHTGTNAAHMLATHSSEGTTQSLVVTFLFFLFLFVFLSI